MIFLFYLIGNSYIVSEMTFYSIYFFISVDKRQYDWQAGSDTSAWGQASNQPVSRKSSRVRRYYRHRQIQCKVIQGNNSLYQTRLSLPNFNTNITTEDIWTWKYWIKNNNIELKTYWQNRVRSSIVIHSTTTTTKKKGFCFIQKIVLKLAVNQTHPLLKYVSL